MGVINVTLSPRRTLIRLLEDLAAVRADIAAFQAALDAHTHGGVATGAGSTAASGASGAAQAARLPFDSALPTRRLIKRLGDSVSLLRLDITNLKNAFDAHTHGGVTTGAGTTGPGPTLAQPPAVPGAIISSGTSVEAFIRRLYRFYNALADTLLAYKSALDNHTHGGVTTGAGTTAASASSPAMTSTNVTFVA